MCMVIIFMKFYAISVMFSLSFCFCNKNKHCSKIPDYCEMSAGNQMIYGVFCYRLTQQRQINLPKTYNKTSHEKLKSKSFQRKIFQITKCQILNNSVFEIEWNGIDFFPVFDYQPQKLCILRIFPIKAPLRNLSFNHIAA